MIALFLIAAEVVVTPICTDRPTKANAVCTVPAGKLQVEASAAGWSLTKADGAQNESWSIGSTVAKLGLDDRSDLEIGFTSWTRIKSRSDGVRSTRSGVGDLSVRYKRRLSPSDAKVQIGLIPFVKLPMAKRGIGNGKLEGGLAVPVSFGVGRTATMTLGPELDALADSDGDGRHLAVVNLANVAVPVADRLTMIGELWTNFNFDPAGTMGQASADAAVAYAVSDDVQIDTGANFGLTSDTADVEIYAGVSMRF